MIETKDLIAELNKDLTAELAAVTRYTYQSAKATGVGGAELRKLLQREIPDELGHALYLSDVIVDLGGEPRTESDDFEKPNSIKDVLELDIKQEESDVSNYRKHAALADEIGEIAIRVRLEEIATDEDRHAREMRRLLKGM